MTPAPYSPHDLVILGFMSRYRWRFIAVPSYHVGFFALGPLECMADEPYRFILGYLGHKSQV